MRRTLLQEAFLELYPERLPPVLNFRYSARFKTYNGNVSITKRGKHISQLTFSLSRDFEESSEEVQKGILQHLMNKAYGTSIRTISQDIYSNFIRHLTRYAKRSESDEYLSELFEELNEEYFNGLLDKPNLTFGNETIHTLGHYQYAQDLVTISSILKEDRELCKYVLYHELLHKKHSFKTSGTRNHYHTKAFRDDEKKFHDKNIEKKLEQFVKKKRRKQLFSSWPFSR